ncbi:ABC transporter ATP-binding protein [Streptomyces tubercidicus]|uniref:ABC transporter ATP-binding protein n=1 Tax=Streptomyces tubercidicus TaxID=47759 RepID=UPI00369733F2
MSAEILVFDGVSVRYRAEQAMPALEPTDLTVRAGEIVCLIGPSGCGKSTMLNLAAGLVSPTSGAVRFRGEKVVGPDPDRGMVFQQYALFGWMNVRRNVEFGLRLKKVGKAERRRIADEQLELVGLSHVADAMPKELSGGMRQRVAIARAYAVEPHLLLMDEPFGALDALTRWRLVEDLVETWQVKRPTICFVTHDIEEAIFLGHRVVVMASNPGRIVEVVEVDHPHPRPQEFAKSPEFGQLREHLWQLVHRDHGMKHAGTTASH